MELKFDRYIERVGEQAETKGTKPSWKFDILI
jgi:hypothetical protein